MLKYSEQADIYVIDNASTDDDVEFLSTNFPSVKIVQNAQNYGFAGGYNEGLKHISADLFCLLNSDVEVSEGWLPPVLDLFNQDETLAAVQPKILDYNQKDQFEYAGAAGGFLDNLGYPFCRGRIFWTLEKDQHQYNDVLPIFGRLARAYLFVAKFSGKRVALMPISLPIWKRLIYAGDYKIWATKFCIADILRCTMWVVALCKKTARAKLI